MEANGDLREKGAQSPCAERKAQGDRFPASTPERATGRKREPLTASSGAANIRDPVEEFRQRLLRGELPTAARPAVKPEEAAPAVKALPPLYATASVSDVPSAVWQQAGGLEALTRPRDVLVTGPNGSGKSHLAAALLNRWGGRWVTTSELLVRVRSSFGRAGGEAEIFERYSECPVLVLDDLTAVSPTDHARSTVLAILDQRLTHLRPTVVTLYHSRDAMRQWDPSIESRLSAFALIRLSGPDRRAARK